MACFYTYAVSTGSNKAKVGTIDEVERDRGGCLRPKCVWMYRIRRPSYVHRIDSSLNCSGDVPATPSSVPTCVRSLAIGDCNIYVFPPTVTYQTVLKVGSASYRTDQSQSDLKVDGGCTSEFKLLYNRPRVDDLYPMWLITPSSYLIRAHFTLLMITTCLMNFRELES